MSETTNFSVRMDKQVKQESESLFKELGMNLTTAINVFLRQAIRSGGFPFSVKMEQPNAETFLALRESDELLKSKTVKRYADVEEALRELKR